MDRMLKKIAPCLLLLSALPIALQAGTVTPIREGWKLQSACKLQAGGDAITAEGLAVDGWLKTSVPNTVLAAQAAAGAVPDPYFGSNLRQIPGTTYPIGGNFANLPMAQDSPYRCGCGTASSSPRLPRPARMSTPGCTSAASTIAAICGSTENESPTPARSPEPIGPTIST